MRALSSSAATVLLLSLGFLTVLFPQPSRATMSQLDALRFIFNSTGGLDGSWGNAFGWNDTANTDYCGLKSANNTWHGVSCASGNLVSGLQLKGNGLVGAFPATLQYLPGLRLLDLSVNGLYGALPGNVLANLTLVDRLFLTSNSLTGPIPSEIGLYMTSLYALYLDNNLFSGSLPDSLGKITRLQYFTVALNRLTGAIPSSLGSIATLTLFLVDYNNLSGTFPAALCQRTLVCGAYGNPQLVCPSGCGDAISNKCNIQSCNCNYACITSDDCAQGVCKRCVPNGVLSYCQH